MNCPYCNQPCEAINFGYATSGLRYQCTNCIGTPAFLDWNRTGSKFEEEAAMRVNFIVPIYRDGSNDLDDFTSLTFCPNNNDTYCAYLNIWFTSHDLIVPGNVFHVFRRISNLKVFL